MGLWDPVDQPGDMSTASTDDHNQCQHDSAQLLHNSPAYDTLATVRPLVRCVAGLLRLLLPSASPQPETRLMPADLPRLTGGGLSPLPCRPNIQTSHWLRRLQ